MKFVLLPNEEYHFLLSLLQTLHQTEHCLLLFEIHVRNQVIFSVQDENPDTFINTKLYLSETTLPAANVEIDYFFVDHGKGFVHPGFEKYDFSPTQNHLATTFAKYGPEFKYQTVLTVNEFPDLQGEGTFHLTTGSSTSGNRYPALVIRSQNEFRFQCEITEVRSVLLIV